MEKERAAAQEPREQQRGGRDPERQRDPMRQEDEGKRREQCRQQKEPLASPRDAGPAGERRKREAKPDEPTKQWHTPDHGRRRGHRALRQRPVPAGERPEVLARDHDAVGAGHAAHSRQAGTLVGVKEHGENCGAIHSERIARSRPPGKCRAAYL